MKMLKHIPLYKIIQIQRYPSQKVTEVRYYVGESKLRLQLELDKMSHKFRGFRMPLCTYEDQHQIREIASKRHKHSAIQDHNLMSSN